MKRKRKPIPGKWWSTARAAECLGVSTQSMTRLARRGVVRAFWIAGRYQFKPRDVLAYRRGCQVVPQARAVPQRVTDAAHEAAVERLRKLGIA